MNPSRLNTLIQDLVEGQISPQNLAELEAELLSNSDSMAHYLVVSDLDNLLQLETAVQNNTPETVPQLASKAVTPSLQAKRIILREKKRTQIRAVYSIAALLLLSFIAVNLYFTFKEKAAPTLTFKVTPGTQFTLTHSNTIDTPQGQILELGSRLQISQGVVELAFKSGVTSIISSPADFTLYSEDQLDMKLGSAWFHVPEKATGFTVKTDQLDIVDLGTDFGVHAKPGSLDEVHVFKGYVTAATYKNVSDAVTLSAGSARKITVDDQLSAIPVSPTSFTTTLPESLPHLHWNFDDPSNEQLIPQVNLPTRQAIESKLLTSNESPTSKPSTGKFGNAISVAPNDHIQTDWHAISGTAPRTVAYWLKIPPGDFHLQPIIAWGAQDGKYDQTNRAFHTYIQQPEEDPFNPPEERAVRNTTTGLSFGAYWLGSYTPIADNQWHHIAYVYTGKSKPDKTPKVYCYIDGKLDPTQHYARSIESGKQLTEVKISTASVDNEGDALSLFNDIWKIRRDDKPLDFEAPPAISMDELYIFQGALSHEEILNLYKNNSIRRP